MIRTLAGLVLLVLVLAAAPGWASVVGVTITFNDLSESPFVTISDPTRASGSCGGEVCTVTVTPPTGATQVFTSPDLIIGDPVNVANPLLTPISDLLETFPDPNDMTGLRQIVQFTSDSDTPGAFCFTSCTGVEDGSTQSGGTITWENSNNAILATDTIMFASDTNEAVGAPEPSSLPLVLTGLLVVAASLRRRRRALG